MESLIKYRLPDDDEGFWIYDAVQAMGLPAFTEYEEKVEKALDKLCPGKYYDILNDIPAAKHDLFVKLCCRYIHTHPEVYFSDDYTKIYKSKIYYEFRKLDARTRSLSQKEHRKAYS